MVCRHIYARTLIYLIYHVPVRKLGCGKLKVDVGTSSFSREGAVGTPVLSTWAGGKSAMGPDGDRNPHPSPCCSVPLWLAALHPTGSAPWLQLGHTNPWAGTAVLCPACAVPCLHLTLPDAARRAESPGGGQKLAERRKPFKITCFR